MKRALLTLVFVAFCAAPLSGADEWGDFYKRGLNAVTARDWPTVKVSMEGAIAQKPVAQKPVRWKNETLTYVPHFYLGIALFELGDVDGALEAFRISESQGVIQKDALWADQRRWEARAQQEKGRSAREATSDVRKTAETAINNATMAKAGAIGAGADRSDEFQKGSRALTDAVAIFDRSGVDQDGYRQVAAKADEARAMFESAQRSVRTRPTTRPVPPPVVDPAKVAEEARLLEELRTDVRTRLGDLDGRLNDAEEKYQDNREFQTFVLNNRSQAEQWTAMLPTIANAAELQRLSQNVTASIEDLAQQTAALRAAAAATAVPAPETEGEPRTAEAVSKTNADLKRAWSAFVKGDVDSCENISSQIVDSRAGSSDAYMLRAIALYTKAMTLEREDLLDRAAADFAAAVRLNRTAKMDKRHFSPKLVSFFEQIKGSIRR